MHTFLEQVCCKKFWVTLSQSVQERFTRPFLFMSGWGMRTRLTWYLITVAEKSLFHTYIHPRTHPCTHPCTRTYTHAHTHIHMHTHTCTYAHTHAHTSTHKHMLSHACTHMHTHTHTCTYMRTHTHTHTHGKLRENVDLMVLLGC